MEVLERIFDTKDIQLDEKSIKVDEVLYPIIDDVIVLIKPEYYTSFVQFNLGSEFKKSNEDEKEFSKDIQYTFGEEWKNYSNIKSEHKDEFSLYFDLVNVNSLSNSTVCDLGCGIGRWSYFLKDKCKDLILIDFSDAIFEARKNLKENNNCLFFMGDIKDLPFKNDFADLLFSLGVLHHLPTECIEEVRNLKKYAPNILIYLYYALDNRPFYFRLLLNFITGIRILVSKVKSKLFRHLFSKIICILIYVPLVSIGKIFEFIKLGKYIPLYDGYKDFSMNRIEQDVYDRFFTSIEQRVSQNDIYKLKDAFSEVEISQKIPYWHFLCKR